MIIKNSLDSIKTVSQNERLSILKNIDNLFPDIENFINISEFDKILGNVLAIEEFNVSTQKFKSSPEELFKSLVYNSSQQFNFWVDPKNQKLRSLSSSDFTDVTSSECYDILNNKAVTLRNERFSILEECKKVFEEFNPLYVKNYINDMRAFNSDFFKKKKNLFFMLLYRYRKDLDLKLDQEWLSSINPAIDYQIPKVLNDLGIISYPEEIENKIKNGILIIKDSIDELFIRSISYKALIMIQEEFEINQINLDTYLWYNRNNYDNLHHCTLTIDY